MTTNAYLRLKELLPPPPLLVAEVIAHNADGTSTLELPGGSQFRARGTIVAIGAAAWVRNGIVEGLAPTRSVLVVLI